VRPELPIRARLRLPRHPLRHRSVVAAIAGASGVALIVFGGCTAPGSHVHGTEAAGERGSGVTRQYFISADQVVWDYAPGRRNEITGKPFGAREDVFVQRGPGRIGSEYLKCLYRGYTDGSFRARQPRPAKDGYLGDLGPVIRAEVGDTIKVVFRNTCPFPASMHPHGVRYTKDNEGAAYADGTGRTHPGDAVPTGHTFTYTWHADARSGPGPMDGPSAVWMYHSHVDEISDVYAGLSGFLIVTARGRARPDGSPKDVDREVFSLFEVDDENHSPLLAANIRRFAGPPAPDPGDEEFVESNLMHSINGYVYGNGPVVQLKKGQRVRWYLMGMGSEVDLHTPHWHGNTVVVNGMRTDVANLLPASMLSADMRPDAMGTWQFHCHVGDHIAAGMQARYQVVD
jgi:FtsP/CotA-like multicopper oxidase with cupredoxin domain